MSDNKTWVCYICGNVNEWEACDNPKWCGMTNSKFPPSPQPTPLSDSCLRYHAGDTGDAKCAGDTGDTGDAKCARDAGDAGDAKCAGDTGDTGDTGDAKCARDAGDAECARDAGDAE